MLLAAVALSFAALARAQVELIVGQALDVTVPVDVDICPFKVVVSAARAGPTCQIALRALFTNQHVAGGNEVQFSWRKDNSKFEPVDVSTYPVADRKYEVLVPCATAGTYYVGTKVTKCPLCVLGVKATYELGAVYKIANVFKFDVAVDTNSRSAWTRVDAASWAYVDFVTTAVGTPHFDFDKTVASMSDNYDYYYGKTGTDFTADTPDRMMLTPSSANLIKIDTLAIGNWTVAVQIKSVPPGTSATEFRFDYSWNSAVSTDNKKADKCPSNVCSKEVNCADCASSNCAWCEGDRKCYAAATCVKANDTAVTDKAMCVDIDGACKAIKDCGACADKDGCVWCNSLEKVGIDVGSCSAGKDNAGVTCSSPTANAVTEKAMCSGSNISLAAAALLAALLAAMTF